MLLKRIIEVKGLGLAIKKKRLEAGKTLQEVADRIGISLQYLSMIEREALDTAIAEEKIREIEAVLNEFLRSQEPQNNKSISELISKQ